MILRCTTMLGLLALLAPADASAGPSHWELSEPVLQGDGVARGTAVAVEDVILRAKDGAFTLRACCGLLDLAECQDSSTYEIAWALDQEVDVLGRGDDVNITLSNTRTSGSFAPISTRTSSLRATTAIPQTA